MIETVATATPDTMAFIEKQAGELTDELLNVRNRLDAVYDAMNGERPKCESGDEKGRAAGSISEIKRLMGNSATVVTEIKKTLSDIESIVLSDVKQPQ